MDLQPIGDVTSPRTEAIDDGREDITATITVDAQGSTPGAAPPGRGSGSPPRAPRTGALCAPDTSASWPAANGYLLRPTQHLGTRRRTTAHRS